MKTRIVICLTGMILMICLTIPAMSAEVAQGKCLKFDTEKNTVTIEEYDTDFAKPHVYGKPTGKQSTFNVATAMIGHDPTPGDILRIAYSVKSGEKIALKVMNVTRQNIMRK